MINKISTAITKRILKELSELKKKKPEEFLAFWKNFGPVIKEGINEMSPVQVSPTHNTTTNLDNAHLVLKEPLMQIFGIQSMEEVITEYCKALCKKGYGNEQFLTLEILKELKEDQLEKMLNFMERPHILAVKKWTRDRK